MNNVERTSMHKMYIEEIISGNHEHQDEFVAECKRLCYAQIRRENFFYVNSDWTVYTREDFFHETFCRMWKNLKKYNPEYAFSTWYSTICRNTYSRLWSKKDGHLSLGDEATLVQVEEKYACTGTEVLCLKERREAWNRLKGQLEGMNENYRKAVKLHYLHGFSVKQIADIMQTKETTVNNWLARGRNKLADFCNREQLKEDLYFEIAA